MELLKIKTPRLLLRQFTIGVTLTLYILMDCFNRCYISKISFVLSDILSSSIFLLLSVCGFCHCFYFQYT